VGTTAHRDVAVIRFVELPGTYSNVTMYEVTNDGEHVGYFVGGEKYARAIETAVMIVQRTPLALNGTK
jgi:hypothetical protein